MSEAFEFGPFRLCPTTRILRKNNVAVILGSRAFDLLVGLVESHGKVLTHRDLMAVAWPGMVIEASNVRVQIAHLRRMLGCGDDGPHYIASVAGRGYCFAAGVKRVESIDPLQDWTSEEGTSAAPSKALNAAKLHRVPSNFPARFEGAIGRDDCICELSQLVQKQRLVTVVGPGGAGKTTLAILVGHALGVSDGSVVFVDLGVVDHDERVAEELASAIGYTSSKAALFQDLLVVLSTRKILIVFDNCEHVLDVVASLCQQIIQATRNVCFLNTSREALGIKDECVYLLRPLSFPSNTERLSAEQAMLWPAIQLFVERAKEGGGSGKLRDDEASIVATLCRRLDGNPHAIEVVARRVGTFGVQGIADLLTNHFPLHWHGRRDSSPRHQTIETMIDWSHNLLPERHRQVLYRLSVFPGNFSIDAAVAVASGEQGDAVRVEEVISDLEYKSLVTTSTVNGEVQFRLLETVKAYAAARLDRLQGKEKTARRHALWYAQQLKKYVGRENRANAESTLPNAPDIENVRAAMDWLVASQQDAELTTNISYGAARLFLDSGLLWECKRCCERAINNIPDHLCSTKIELDLLELMAVTYYSVGDYDGEITNVIERGLAISRYIGDSSSTFHLLAGQHLVMMTGGNFQQSLAISECYACEASYNGGISEAVIANWLAGVSNHYMGNQMLADSNLFTGTQTAVRNKLRPLRYFELKQQIIASTEMARGALIRGLPIQALKLAVKGLRQCLAQLPSSKISVVRMDALQALSEALRESGNSFESLLVINEAIDLAKNTCGVFNLADLLRTKTEVMMSLPYLDQSTIDDVLSKTISV
ncbi:ATP-binding protein [Pseudomonas synxantha]|uniref:ATPase n=1 Tax=Pseudomonas synxantha TaxID=47883 RepID=A0A5D3G9Y5_9PSED|nr:winged helix-turn-helix domain-containing protein [Pseudomonas synxantha]TYK57867.1 ATPase [Pseudomonas synxantha]